jgi:hypothetical protein
MTFSYSLNKIWLLILFGNLKQLFHFQIVIWCIPLSTISKNHRYLIYVVCLIFLEQYNRRIATENFWDFGVCMQGGQRNRRPNGLVPGIFGKVNLLIHGLDYFKVLQLFSLWHLLLWAFLSCLWRHLIINFKIMGSMISRNRFWWYRSLYDDYCGREIRLTFGLASIIWLPHYWYDLNFLLI